MSFAAAALVLLVAGEARAGAPTAVEISPGVTLGTAKADFIFGGEVSVSRSHFTLYSIPYLWYGAYADGVYDGAASRGRFTVGPELGAGPLGIDGGLVATTSGDLGWGFRLLLGVGYVFGYARWLYVDDPRTPSRSTPIHEFGVLLKYPLRPFGLDDGLPPAVPPEPPQPPPPAPTPTPEPTDPNSLPVATPPADAAL
jgi:hypothetical protein